MSVKGEQHHSWEILSMSSTIDYKQALKALRFHIVSITMRPLLLVNTLIFLWSIDCSYSSITLGTCRLSCNENEDEAHTVLGPSVTNRVVGVPGKVGPKGPKGVRGPRGEKGSTGACDCDPYQQLLEEISSLRQMNDELRRQSFPRDCIESKKSVMKSGVRIIFPFASTSNGIPVYCDQDTDDGGWIVIQRRVGGPVDFYRGWDDYVTGFGNKEGDFWLGLETIHQLTKNGTYELRVDLEDISKNRAFAKYKVFSLEGADKNYQLNAREYSGTAGDSFVNLDRRQFSTKDRDNDLYPGNCAEMFTGAWWYNACHTSNLNGKYGAGASTAKGVSWKPWKDTHESMKRAEMKIRKKG